jgi:sigma-E factor negative regulatory protein RseA
MSEQIREQVSAFLDGELPNSETELLLKRLARDGELRESFGRYALIGEALRGGSHKLMAKGFSSRVNLAIDGEPIPANGHPQDGRVPRWWRPLAGAAVAAGVAAVAVVALQQRAVAPTLRSGAVLTAQNAAPAQSAVLTAQNAASAQSAVLAQNAAVSQGVALAPGGSLQAPREAISYTVPASSTATPAAMPPARLTSYIFAHSRYSSGLDQRGVLADLLIEAEDQPPPSHEAAPPASSP